MSPTVIPLIASAVTCLLAVAVGYLEQRAYDKRKATAARSRRAAPVVKPSLRRV
jgi:hypothetical protein